MNQIIQCLLFLNNNTNVDHFIDSKNNELNIHTICTCPKITQIMAVARAFLKLFGCPPSRHIITECLKDPVSIITTQWPFMSRDEVNQVYMQALHNMTNVSNVRQVIVDVLSHHDQHDVTNLVASFIRVFKTVKRWQDVDEAIHRHLMDWYTISRCIESTCVVVNTDVNIAMFLNVISGSTPNHLHVFSRLEHSPEYIRHVCDIKTFPINIFKHCVYLDSNMIHIGRTRLQLDIHIEKHAELAGHIVKGAMGIQDPCRYLYFWNYIIPMWDRIITPSVFQHKQSENAVAVFETRKNPLSVMSCLLTCNHLDRDMWRGVIVFCNKDHVQYYTQELGLAACEVIGLDVLTKTKFILDDYNDILKSELIWDMLKARGIKRVLIVQDDGFIVRPGVERFLEWDYVGAPWRQGQDTLCSMSNPELVGNGGLSLRNVDVMHVITRQNKEKERWPGTFSQTPEDTHFAKQVHVNNYKLCPRDKALHFASEQVCTKGCCGVHKPWPYLTVQELESLNDEKEWNGYNNPSDAQHNL